MKPIRTLGELEFMLHHLEERIERDATECQNFMDLLNDWFLVQQTTGNVNATKKLKRGLKQFMEYTSDLYLSCLRLTEGIRFAVQMKKEEYDVMVACAVDEILAHKEKLPESWFEDPTERSGSVCCPDAGKEGSMVEPESAG